MKIKAAIENKVIRVFVERGFTKNPGIILETKKIISLLKKIRVRISYLFVTNIFLFGEPIILLAPT